MKQVLHDLGYDDVLIVSPSSADGYSSLGEYAGPMMRLGWWGLVGSDAIRKMLHIYRPHETERGAADTACNRALDIFCDALADSSVPIGPKKLTQLAGALAAGRDLFRAIPVDFERDTKLVGVVGEIFCRLSTFSNEDLIRRLEAFGAQAWLSDIGEWVWYTNFEQKKNLKMYGQGFSLEMLKVRIKEHVQHGHEAKLLAPFREEFAGLEEPHDVLEVLEHSEPYLPYRGALGEMVLSVGKAIYMYEKGVDGIIDISPFTCMNGIICESVYPKVSRDCDGIPIRTFYFDGSQTDLENDLGIFMELVSNYSRRKMKKRSRRKAA
jgi:predicted nucleotide-binding protein (sugar kinase/HSP70/actin superfamily)